MHRVFRFCTAFAQKSGFTDLSYAQAVVVKPDLLSSVLSKKVCLKYKNGFVDKSLLLLLLFLFIYIFYLVSMLSVFHNTQNI